MHQDCPDLKSFPVSGEALWQWRSLAQQQAIATAVSVDELDWLLQELTGLERLTLQLGSLRQQQQVNLRVSLDTLAHLWQQRLTERTPVQYLAGSTPWRQFSLLVSPAVLIPRPETELIVDLAIAAIQRQPRLSQGHWVDLGTGSGAIALALADRFPQATIHAVDVSQDALAIAVQNAQRLQLGDRVQFYQGNWFEPLAVLKGRLSGVVSNPPYIPSAMIPDLQPEVTRHEPHLALNGGTDGLDCIRHLVTTAPDYLHSGGFWLTELMAGQGDTVAELLSADGRYHQIAIHPDLAGIDRFALAYRT